MNVDGLADIDRFQVLNADVFVDALNDHFKGCHDDQLDQARLAQHSSERYQYSSSAKVCYQETKDECKQDLFPITSLTSPSCFLGQLLFEADLKGLEIVAQETSDYQSPLEDERGYQQVEGQATKSVAL